MADHNVLFVCLGNICRSPVAEGVFRAEVERRGLGDQVLVDSCGTGGWHVGEPPDARSAAVAKRHGVDISPQRARQLSDADYRKFDWLVAMDNTNFANIRRRAPRKSKAHIVRFTDYVEGAYGTDVPDPYYGDGDGFQRVYDLLEKGAPKLLDAVLG